MKKIIFILTVVASIVFTACSASTEVKILSANGFESETTYTFSDFFNAEEIVHIDRDKTSTAIVVDKNTGVLYVRKHTGYQWGMSPIYDSDGSILTYDKWLAKRAKKE